MKKLAILALCAFVVYVVGGALVVSIPKGLIFQVVDALNNLSHLVGGV